MSLKKVCLLVSSVALLNGCATYAPPNKPASQTAHIEEFDGEELCIDISKINGIRTPASTGKFFPPTINPFTKEFWIDDTRGTETFAIEPGPCTVDLYYTTGAAYANGQVFFNAQAGHSYVIQTKSEMTGNWFKSEWIKFSVIDKNEIKSKKAKPPNQI